MTERRSLGSRLQAAVSSFGLSRIRRKRQAGNATFRLMYDRFREILALNDAMLDLIADLEEATAGRLALGRGAVERRVRKGAMDAFVMVKNLNQLARGRYGGLFEALSGLSGVLDSRLEGPEVAAEGPLTVPMVQAHTAGHQFAGSKMATLAEAAAACSVRIPDGFVVSTLAADRFLASGELWERCERLEAVFELHGDAALDDACAEVGAAILATPVPDDVASAIEAAFTSTFCGDDVRVAVRSSAVGEDAAGSSHAGVYRSELGVGRTGVLESYRRVLASAFLPTAVAYRQRHGMAARDALMAVGVVRMIDARCAGIMYSRPPEDPRRDAVVVGVTLGSAAGIAAGNEDGEYLELGPAGPEDASAILRSGELGELRDTARRLEGHFGAPQDVEWAIDRGGSLYVLQSRPVVMAGADESSADEEGEGALAVGGRCACPGVAHGPVVRVDAAGALADFPAGGVLVARHSDAAFARVMERCTAIVTDVGLPTGHMASLAREYGVPSIVGLAGATALLPPDTLVTVDATRCRVFGGVRALPVAAARTVVRGVPGGAAKAAGVERVAPLVTPLHLTDPTAANFVPEACRSLHDIARFVHEKAFEVMFHYGDLAALDRDNSFRLDAKLPITVRVFDLGGGVSGERGSRRSVTPEEIASAPMVAFLQGLLETRIRWDLPRPVSLRGFLSVLGEGVAGPPADTLQVGRLSYAIVSDSYMNFSTKAGYHFSTVDSYCGESQGKNYIHFRFSGGAADTSRRERRVGFLSAVLTSLGFAVSTRGDVLTARLDKYGGATVKERLVDLGRLTLCARQLDMLMDSDASPQEFATAFLEGTWERF